LKTFIISTVIFAVMISMIIFNYIYINNSADRLEELTSAIIPDSGDLEERVKVLEDYWEDNKVRIGLVSNHTIINNIGIKIANIRLFTDKGDDFCLAKELILLKEDIKELRRLERLSAENIF